MEAIRHIQTVENGEVHLRLPQQFWGREVEIIVLPAPLSAEQSPTNKRSLRGALKHPVQPERLGLGTALAELGRRVGLTDDDIAAIEQVRDKSPAEPLRFE